MKTPRILIIYTGGTIGMKEDPDTLALVPFDFSQISQEVPQIRKFGYEIEADSFDAPIDSSDAGPKLWIKIASHIEKRYNEFDGFVVLHGTDTMAYSASALSFMLDNLEKPVIFTGSQLPIGMLRTDGAENLISSIEIAASRGLDGSPMVPEVCVYFQNQLFRANRTTKYNAENFHAFSSANYPPLAEVGIHIDFNTRLINYPSQRGWPLGVNTSLDTSVISVKLVPGMSESGFASICATPGIKAIVIESFGTGNVPSDEWFVKPLREAAARGVLLVNVSQCAAGKVDMDAYANGRVMKDLGAVSGYDATFESVITKLYCLLGTHKDLNMVKRLMNMNLKGEISKK
ncbi:MAG: asparaginase [Bacteroidales bacterium]|nr:asparaginase [Bacteroidales bacterium]